MVLTFLILSIHRSNLSFLTGYIVSSNFGSYPRVKHIEWWKMVDRNQRKRKRKFVPYTFLHEQSKTTKLRQHAYIKIKMEGELSSCHEKPKERLTCSKTYKHVSDQMIFETFIYHRFHIKNYSLEISIWECKIRDLQNELISWNIVTL